VAQTPKVSADTWAVVDGRQIMRDDVEKAFRRSGQAAEASSDEEAMTAKLSLLNELIAQDLLLAKARALKLELPESELDTAFEEARKNVTGEAFQQELKRRGVTAAEMREGLRRELLAQKVIDQEAVAKIGIADAEVTAFFEANRAQFNFPEEGYRLAQIVVTPVPGPSQANRSGDDAATPQAAALKIKTLMDQLKAGVSFANLAVSYSEDPESAARGGDVGFVPVSRLNNAPTALREMVLKSKPGTASVVSVPGAHMIVLVVAHEPAGQRDLSVPAVRETITSRLRSNKEQLLRAAYLTAMRNDATVVNYIARRLVEAQGKLPSPASAPAGAK
jgi:peptidyl-prolyl cis-trans isomerase SurA